MILHIIGALAGAVVGILTFLLIYYFYRKSTSSNFSAKDGRSKFISR